MVKFFGIVLSVKKTFLCCNFYVSRILASVKISSKFNTYSNLRLGRNYLPVGTVPTQSILKRDGHRETP